MDAEHVQDWSKTMAEVYHTIQKESYFPIKVKPAMIKALDAFAQEADEHNQFLGPEHYGELRKKAAGTFYGIGVELAPKQNDDDFVMVLNVKPGSPAHKEKLQRYDKIVAIDGVPVAGLSIDHCIDKLKGEKRYSLVTLDIIREHKGALKATIQRDLIPEEHCWCYYMPYQGIVYCALSLFTQEVRTQLEAALMKAVSKKPKGIILDLRDNPGGVLKAAVECAAAFLAKHSLVVTTRGRSNRIIEQHYTTSDPLVKNDIPIIILVNGLTASSAEFFAQALRIYSKEGRRAISPYVFILGTQTYGKGSIQEVKPLSNQCALKVTTGLYYLPDNTSIQGKGILPDFVIKQKYPQTEEMKLIEKMEQKKHAKKKNRSMDKAFKGVDHERKHALKKDYQVQCACNLLLLVDLAKTLTPREVGTHDRMLTWLRQHFTCPTALSIQDLN